MRDRVAPLLYPQPVNQPHPCELEKVMSRPKKGVKPEYVRDDVVIQLRAPKQVHEQVAGIAAARGMLLRDVVGFALKWFLSLEWDVQSIILGQIKRPEVRLLILQHLQDEEKRILSQRPATTRRA